MQVSRRRLLAGGVVLLAGGTVGLASNTRTRGLLDAIEQRATTALARRMQAGPALPPTSVTINVDPGRVLRPISPLIYGVAHAGESELLALGASLNRWGGNPNTRYNWVHGSAWNAARDWEFRNYGEDASQPRAKLSASDEFVGLNQSLAVATEMTVPAIGWVARNGDKQVQSTSVPGNGGPPLRPGIDAVSGYDPGENRQRTSVSSQARKGAPFVDQPDRSGDIVYQDEWVRHLVNHFGSSDDGGVRYYVVDNEPDLWAFTHTDVHPVQPGYDEVLSRFLDYATAIKAVDPGAKVVGPALSGWQGYFYSALDQGADHYRTHADRQAHGDMPFLAWWLDQVRKHDERNGNRTLDVLDVHFYPQAPGVWSPADDPETRSVRLRSTRSLWDPAYIDESWIGDAVRLIPRLREWRDTYYPGTQIAIGEWNWGADTTIGGALAVADVLGIFGREGIDLASYWTFPPLDSPAASAFAMYTRYNDRGDSFGDRAVSTEVEASPDYVTAYSSVDSTSGDVMVMLINKLDMGALPAQLIVKGGGRGLEVFRLAAGNSGITSLGSTPIEGSEIQLTLPPSSVTLMRVARA